MQSHRSGQSPVLLRKGYHAPNPNSAHDRLPPAVKMQSGVKVTSGEVWVGVTRIGMRGGWVGTGSDGIGSDGIGSDRMGSGRIR